MICVHVCMCENFFCGGENVRNIAYCLVHVYLCFACTMFFYLTQENLNTWSYTCKFTEVERHDVSSWHFHLHRQSFMHMIRCKIQIDIAYRIGKFTQTQIDVRACCVHNPEYPNCTQKHTQGERERQRAKDREEEVDTKEPKYNRDRAPADF